MFDAALIESGTMPRPDGRRVSLPLAISLHAATIAALVASSVWRPGEPPEPELPIAIAFPETARSLPPSGSGANAVIRSVSPSRGAETLPRRLPVPDRIAEIEPRMPDEGGESPSDLDGPNDGPGATGGGDDLGGGAGPGLDGGAGGGGPIPVAGDVRAPQLVFRVEPDYPESMRRSRVEGTVVAEAVITAGGDVESVRVVRSVNPILDRAVAEAVRRWRYRAATLDGRPVAVYLTVTVRFGLRS